MSIINMLKTWWKGRKGESHISNLNNCLSPTEYLVINGLTLKNKQEDIEKYKLADTYQIDHLILSLNTGAIFVVETKNITGEINGDISDKKWTLKNENGSFGISNYLRQNYGHIKGVQKLLSENGYKIENERIFSVVMILKDKYNSNHFITDKTNGNNHWFKKENIVTSSEDYLELITSKTHELKEKIELSLNQNQDNDVKQMKFISPMEVRQQFNLLKAQNETGVLAHLEHVQNVKKNRRNNL